MMIRLLIALLLFAAVPVMAAEDQTPTAPALAQQQVRDALLEQLQTQAREAEARAGEAERRERDAELERLADQVRQAQARAGEEAQLKLAAQRELSIQEAKAELQNNAYSRLEIMLGAFGILITIIVFIITLRTEKTAVAEAVSVAIPAAKEAAMKGVEDLRESIKKIALDVEKLGQEAEVNVSKIRENKIKSDEMIQMPISNEQQQAINRSEAPKSTEEHKTVADFAKQAVAKLPGNRSNEEYRAIITDLFVQKKWLEMLTAAQQMRILHERDDDFGFACFHEAFALGELGRREKAIEVYDDLVARLGSAPEAALCEWVARALYNKGIALEHLNRSMESISVYDELVVRLGASTTPELQYFVASVLVNKGAALGKMQRPAEAIVVLDDAIARYEHNTVPLLQEQVAKALVNKAVALGQLQRTEEAFVILDNLVARYKSSSSPSLQQSVASALANKGAVLGQMHRLEEAIAVFDEVISQYGASSELAMQELVGVSLFNKGTTLGLLQRLEEAIAVFDDVIRRYGRSTAPSLQEQVRRAQYNKNIAVEQLHQQQGKK